MQSPVTLLFAGPDGAPVAVSASNPLPVTTSGGGAIMTFVAFPASAIASGTQGQVSYQNGYGALCVATNTWVFWTTSSDYPF